MRTRTEKRNDYLSLFKEKIRAEHWILLLILVTGAILRLKGLTLQSLWFDELMSVTWSAPKLSFAKIISIYQGDPHPPLFPLLLHYWMMVFGYTDWAARLLTALIGCGSIYSIYLLGKESFNKQTGLIASAVIALNYFNLYYSHEVRSYILLFLLTTLSYTFFLKLLREQTRKNMIVYSVVTALMLYTHYFGLVTLSAQVIFLLFPLVFDKDASRPHLLKYFSLSGVLIVVFYSPWIPTTIKMMGKTSHWTKAPKADFFVTLFRFYFGREHFLVILFAVLVLSLLFYFILPKRDGSAAGDDGGRLNLSLPVLFSWVFFTLFIPYYRSLAAVPMYQYYYVIGTLAAVVVLGAVSITSIKNNTFKALLLTAVFLVSFTSIFHRLDYYNKITKEDWRGTAEYVVKQGREKYGDKTIYVMAKFAFLYNFYFDSLDAEVRIQRPDVGLLKKILREHGKEGGEGPAIWVLTGHNYEPGERFMHYVTKHFDEIETKEIKKGWIKRFELKKGVSQPLSGL